MSTKKQTRLIPAEEVQIRIDTDDDWHARAVVLSASRTLALDVAWQVEKRMREFFRDELERLRMENIAINRALRKVMRNVDPVTAQTITSAITEMYKELRGEQGGGKD